MKVAIATADKTQDSYISDKLADAKYLFIVEVEKYQVLNIYEAEAKDNDFIFAKKTVEDYCEAIICGNIEKEPFDILAREGACVTRYNGAGKTVLEALKLYCNNELELIRDHIDGPGCPGHTSGGSCKGHEHD